MNEKVKEIRDYLEKKGYIVTETAIIDMAIDLARRLGAGKWSFACEAKTRKEKAEEERERQRNG